jgi:thiamine biosynthesis lipoprotein
MRATWVLAAFAVHCMQTQAATAAGPTRFAFESRHMGTTFRIVVIADRPTAERAAATGFQRVAAIEQALSDYKPDSEVMRACQANDAAPGVPIGVSDDLYAVLAKSGEMAKVSGGAFDVTVGPLTKLWRVSRKTQVLPAAAELKAALALVGPDKLTLDPKTRTMTLAKPGMRLDFGGIGKGYAADEVLKLLKRNFGINAALVAAAGDITCGDAPPGETGWDIEIAPLRTGDPRRRLVLANSSVSTSGDLEQVAVIGGVRYSHLLNPKTGLGLTGQRSVTVIAPTGTTADSATKAASVLPAAEALAVIAKIPGAEVLIVTQLDDAKPEALTQSAGFRHYMRRDGP